MELLSVLGALAGSGVLYLIVQKFRFFIRSTDEGYEWGCGFTKRPLM